MSQATHWQKSSFSEGGDGNTCVELAPHSDHFRLRESESPDDELSVTAAPLANLIRGVKAGTVRTTA